jgi:hypothetical protein
MTTSLQVFDPAMCCSTGICGPSVEPKLIRFAADLEWLASCGVSVERFNLAQQPQAFVQNEAAKRALEAQGEAALPLILVDGAVKSSGIYPSREQLAEWARVAVTVCGCEETDTTGASSCCCGPKASGDSPKKSKCCC